MLLRDLYQLTIQFQALYDLEGNPEIDFHDFQHVIAGSIPALGNEPVAPSIEGEAIVFCWEYLYRDGVRLSWETLEYRINLISQAFTTKEWKLTEQFKQTIETLYPQWEELISRLVPYDDLIWLEPDESIYV